VIAIVSYDAASGLRDNHRPDELQDLLRGEGRVVWVDFSVPTKEDTAVLSSVFQFHPLSIEDCEARRQQPKIDDYRDYLFIMTHGVHPESSTREFRTRQLSIYLGRNYIVTFHKEKSRSVIHTLESARKNHRVISDGPGSVLYNILDFQVDQYFPVMDNFEKKIDEIEDRVFTSQTAVILEEVLTLKRALMRLRRISGHQRDILSRLIRREFALIDEHTAINLRDVFDHLVRITDLADTYRELVASVLDAHLSIVSNRTNDIMRALTVVATLFIPLTFIAGVYGMNFEYMPELHWRYGYLLVWGLMIGVAVFMYRLFRKRGIAPGPES